MRGQHAEGVRRRLGRAEGGRAGVVQAPAQRPHAGIAHEAGDHRLARLGRQLGQLRGHGGNVGTRVRRQQHQHAVDVGVFLQRVHHRLGAGGRERQIGDDGIGRRDARLQYLAQRPQGGRRQLGAHRGRVRPHQVQGQLGRPAAVGDQGDAPPARPARIAQHLQGREELYEIAHADRAGAAQRGVEHGIGQAGIQRPARLQHDHGLDAGGRAQRAHELTGETDLFHVKRDAVGARVAGQVVQHLRQSQDRLVAQGQRRGEADLHILGPVHHRGHDGARLRHQRHLAAACQQRMLAEIQPRVRTLHAEGVRPQQGAFVRQRPVAAQRAASGGVGIRLVVRQEDGAGGPPRSQPRQRLRQQPGRHADQRQVRPALSHFRRWPAGGLARRAVGQHQLLAQGGRQGVQDGQGTIGGHQQCARLEQRGEGVTQHEGGFSPESTVRWRQGRDHMRKPRQERHCPAVIRLRPLK
ncbi:hypothetical protein RAN3_0679 [plant metagenome]|uniref:Uncharacterized protein n=1 Tax=plant metagenome TaxID=1297885 RepID=A0A484V3E9_9ZZZZ